MIAIIWRICGYTNTFPRSTWFSELTQIQFIKKRYDLYNNIECNMINSIRNSIVDIETGCCTPARRGEEGRILQAQDVGGGEEDERRGPLFPQAQLSARSVQIPLKTCIFRMKTCIFRAGSVLRKLKTCIFRMKTCTFTVGIRPNTDRNLHFPSEKWPFLELK